MSHETARRLIADAWESVWNSSALKATVPIEYQNQPFAKPSNKAWGRYTLLPGQTEPAALGTRGMKVERTPFVLIVQIFHPENTGTSMGFKVSDIMKGLDYSKRRAPDGSVVVSFDTAGLTPGFAEDGVDAFNVTINGRWDSYQLAAAP